MFDVNWGADDSYLRMDIEGWQSSLMRTLVGSSVRWVIYPLKGIWIYYTQSLHYQG